MFFKLDIPCSLATGFLSSVILACPESFFKIPDMHEGFPTSGNDNKNKDSILRYPAVSAAGLVHLKT